MVQVNLFILSTTSNYYELREAWRCTENFLPLVSFYIKETISSSDFNCNAHLIDYCARKCSECWVLKGKKKKPIFVLKNFTVTNILAEPHSTVCYVLKYR